MALWSCPLNDMLDEDHANASKGRGGYVSERAMGPNRLMLQSEGTRLSSTSAKARSAAIATHLEKPPLQC